MATAPNIANDDAPIVAGEILLLPVDQIEIGERLRSIDEVWALALGTIMAKEGQDTAIDVCALPGKAGYRLVAGAHRLTGARLVGMEMIEARIVSASAARRKMREISENLWRRDLGPIDRAAFMAELVVLKREAVGLEAAAHRTASVAKRWQKQLDEEASETVETISNVYGFSEEVGQMLGLTGRTVRNDLLLYRRLAPSLVERLRQARHPLATNASQLRALTKLEPAQQVQVVDLLLGGWNGKVGDAVAKVLGTNRAVDPQAKRLSTFIGTFNRMELAEKKGALFQLKGLLPAGHKLINGEYEGKPEERYRLQVAEALESAFDILLRLQGEGEAVEDEEIAAARGKVQLALFAVNGGVVPMPKGGAA